MTLLTCALGPDSAGDVVTGLLRGAAASIDAAVYEVGPSYRWALIAAVRRGVRVRLLLDHHACDGNALTAARLNAAGGECRVPPAGFQAHAKLLVIDGKRVAIGSGNLVWRDAPRHFHRKAAAATPLAGTREWWAVVSGSDAVVAEACQGFRTAWERGGAPPARWAQAAAAVAPPVGVPRPQVPPRRFELAPGRIRLICGGEAIAEALGRLIAGARRRVLAIVPYVSTDAGAAAGLLRALAAACAKGVDARLLLGEPPGPGWSGRGLAEPAGIRFMNPLASTVGHAKGLVTDGVVVVSSANWSGPGLGAGFEAALAVDQARAAEYFAGAWARDWASGIEL